MSRPIVPKYGGSILFSSRLFTDAARYQIGKGPVGFVSAVNGDTNLYMDIFDGKNPRGSNRERYKEILAGLPPELRMRAESDIESEMQRMEIYLDKRARDEFVGSPEFISAILNSYYIKAEGRDAVCLSGPDAGFLLDDYGLIDMEASREPLRENIGRKLDEGNIVIVSGFLGKHHKTGQYKLGARNIGDAFAAAGAAALDGDVEIVKDVPGIYHVPPKPYGNYGIVDNISYGEARRMTWKGSPVVHPSAVRIAQNNGMKITVKDMESKGTVISDKTQTTIERPVAGIVPEKTFMITVFDDIMDTPEGRGYLGHVSQHEAQRGNDVGLVATDVGSISYTISLGDRKRPENNGHILEEHNRSLRDHLNSHGYGATIDGQEVGMITLVGDGMQRRAGTLSYLSGVLGRNGISIRCTSQSDEKYGPPSIIFVVDKDELETSVRALSDELFAKS